MSEFTHAFTLILIGYYPAELAWRLLLSMILIGVHGYCFCYMLAKRSGLISHLSLWVICQLAVLVLVFGDGVILENIAYHQVSGLALNILMSYWAIPIGTMMALVFAYWVLTSPIKFVRKLDDYFLTIIRSVPLITLLFISTLVIPLLVPDWFNANRLQWSIMALSFFVCAYCTQIFKGTYLAITTASHEAASALCFTRWQKFRYITMQPMLKVSLPALFNTYIGIFKDTTLIMIIGQSDSLGIISTLIAQPDFKHYFIEYFALIAAIFWGLCLAIACFGRALEKRESYE